MTTDLTTPVREPVRDPRRLGLGAAAIIAGYTLVIGAIMAGLIGPGGSDDYRPPQAMLRSLVLFGLFLLPAAVAAIGAVRRSRPLLIAGGVLALGQSFIAFSGVTIPFIVPAILLIVLGVAGSGSAAPRRAIVGALAVVLLGIAAWVLPLALSETSCWIARSGPDGTIVYSAVPETDTFTLGSAELAAGCDGGAMTAQGAALAVVLAVGAVGMAVLTSTRAVASRS